jgi:hypothetical protein
MILRQRHLKREYHHPPLQQQKVDDGPSPLPLQIHLHHSHFIRSSPSTVSSSPPPLESVVASSSFRLRVGRDDGGTGREIDESNMNARPSGSVTVGENGGRQ